jgi:hypothetical protein
LLGCAEAVRSRTSSATRLKNSAPVLQNAKRSPLTGEVKDVVSTKNLPASGGCLRDLPSTVRHSGRLRAHLAFTLGASVGSRRGQGFCCPLLTYPLPPRFDALRSQQHAYNAPDTRVIEAETASNVTALTREALPARCRVRTEARQIWTCCEVRQQRSDQISSHQTADWRR